jgi:DNA-binding NtrC family response regulator
VPEVSLANVHVLVVDDDSDARGPIQRLLHLGRNRANSASEAMERILAERLAVLVCGRN